MSISFDNIPSFQPRRSASAPTSSLLHRIQKPPLADRLSTTKDDSGVKAPTGPRNSTGPIRTKQQRGGRGGGGGRGNAAVVAAPRAARTKAESKKPKTAEDLDKELDAFMVDDATTTAASAPAATVVAEADVDMA